VTLAALLVTLVALLVTLVVLLATLAALLVTLVALLVTLVALLAITDVAVKPKDPLGKKLSKLSKMMDSIPGPALISAHLATCSTCN
jgi:hypothetical protein